MNNYKLIRYGILDAREEIVFEHHELSRVHNEAIQLSSQDVVNGESYWTYRLERWENDKRVIGFRFYNAGEEFTQKIRDDALNNQNEEK